MPFLQLDYQFLFPQLLYGTHQGWLQYSLLPNYPYFLQYNDVNRKFQIWLQFAKAI